MRMILVHRRVGLTPAVSIHGLPRHDVTIYEALNLSLDRPIADETNNRQIV
jgi:hypothetical protein